jgi:hypothetical protein
MGLAGNGGVGGYVRLGYETLGFFDDAFGKTGGHGFVMAAGEATRVKAGGGVAGCGGVS